MEVVAIGVFLDEIARVERLQASAALVNDLARSRVGEVLTATEPRVVQRPASRFTFPAEPMVALRGPTRAVSA